MARRSPTRTAKSGLAALAGGVVLLVTAALVQPALGAVAALPYDDNLTCAYFGWSSSFKIDAQPTAGDYTASTPKVETQGAIPAGMIVTISNVVVDTTAKTVTFDWSTTKSATEVRINAVLVKFADGGLRYDYGQAGATGDVGLQSTKDSISHVDFCFGVYEPTTTTTEKATTTTTDGQRLTTTTEAVTTTTEEATTTTEEPTTTTTAVSPASEERTSTTPASVGGVQIQRELPRTGLATLPLSLMGIGLIGVGLLLIAYDRRQALRTS